MTSKPAPRPVRENPSGHISMNVQLSNFYRELNEKTHRITALHEAGVLGNRRDRNPLAAEKSPRNEFYGYDFNPPPPKNPEKPRWTYPESDWGLMAKFQSQKQIYETIYERERSQKQIEQEIKSLREKNLSIIESELKKRADLLAQEKIELEQKDQAFAKAQDMITNPQKYMHMNQSTTQHQKQQHQNYPFDDRVLLEDLNDHPSQNKRSETPVIKFSPEKLNMKESNLFNKFGKSSQNQELLNKALNHAVESSSSATAAAALTGNQKMSKAALRETKRQTKKNLDLYEKNLLNTYKTLTNVPVANIRSLQETYPEVLKQYRTERAAEFIAKRGNAAINPPVPRELATVPFRPGGVLPATSKEQSPGKKRNQKSQSFNDISLPIDILTEQLKKTEDEIAFQKVKIGLNAKPTKTFQKTIK